MFLALTYAVAWWFHWEEGVRVKFILLRFSHMTLLPFTMSMATICLPHCTIWFEFDIWGSQYLILKVACILTWTIFFYTLIFLFPLGWNDTSNLNFEPYFHLHTQNQQVLLPDNFALPPCIREYIVSNHLHCY